jgi:hypothetical protein
LDTQFPGDTFVSVPYGGIIDTRTGYGDPLGQGQIPAGGSVTIQVTGAAGIPGDANGAALYLGAANASQSGWVSAYPAGSSDPGTPMVSYTPGHTVRNLFYGSLSSSGQLTLTNHGTAPVDLMAAAQGYLVSPTAAEAGGTFVSVTPQRIADTRYGTGGVPATPVPAGGSITFAATGVGGIPANGVPAVVESVAASSPTATGLLSVYPAGGTDPGNAGVNFNGGDSQDNDLTAPLVSAVSPTGQETITNHSSGTVDVIVSVMGYYQAPTLPNAPESVTAAISGSTATLNWNAPNGDGGAAVTSYTVTASPDSATVTVSGATDAATLSGLANAASDVFRVTATNAVGSGIANTYSPPNVITGRVVAPNAAATPVVGDLITIFPNADSASGTPTVIGTATTDASGYWSFTVPPYSRLPADSQAAAAANGGYLNVDAFGMGNATAGGKTFEVAAIGIRSAWVGTSTQTQPPALLSSQAQPLMIMHPNQADASTLDTPTAEAATWVSQNNPEATDANYNGIGNGNAAYPPAPTDQYGFQEIGGNGSYNPNIAADGTTNLTNAPITPATASNASNCCQPYGCLPIQVGGTRKSGYGWTIVGEWHAAWDELGNLKYTSGASTNIQSAYAIDGKDWDLGGWDNYTASSGLSGGVGNTHTERAWQDAISMKYHKHRYNACQYDHNYRCDGTICYWYDQWDPYAAEAQPNGPIMINLNDIYDKQNKSGTRWRTDGFQAWEAAEDSSTVRQWIIGQPWGFDLGLNISAGVTYGVGATIFGIGLSTETDHTNATEQSVTANLGNSRPDYYRNDPLYNPPISDDVHYIWGSNGPLNFGGSPEPKTFYTY